MDDAESVPLADTGEDLAVPSQEKVRVVLRLRPLQRREYSHPLALEQLSGTRCARRRRVSPWTHAQAACVCARRAARW